MFTYLRDVAPCQCLLHDGKNPSKVGIPLRHFPVGQAVCGPSAERQWHLKFNAPLCKLGGNTADEFFVAGAFSALFVIIRERRGEMVFRNPVYLSLRQRHAQRSRLDQRCGVCEYTVERNEYGLGKDVGSLHVLRSEGFLEPDLPRPGDTEHGGGGFLKLLRDFLLCVEGPVTVLDLLH